MLKTQTSDISLMNELAREMQPTPSDWLFNSARNFFHTRPKSAMGCSYCIYSTLVLHRKRNSYQVEEHKKTWLLSSYETWNDLIGNGWRLVEQQFNAFVDTGIKIPPGLYVPHKRRSSFHKTLSSDLDIKIIYPGKVLVIKKGKAPK